MRKNKGLSLSGIIAAITGVRPQGPWGKLVDLMFLIATVGALTISLVVTAATFTRGLSALTGLPDNFTVQAFVILLSGGIFCLSSLIGINNGLQRLSKMVGWGAFLLPLLVLIVGPTEFITNSIINAIGLTTQNFLQMSLFTDPLGDGSFTRNWTVFYWLWWISYTPGVAMFVTRVSRGRKIKEVIWGLILGSTVGCWFFFGVMESYAIHQFINGVINVPQVLETLGGETAVQQVLMSLPAGKLFLAAYLGVMIIFLASHMDAVAYTMAATSTRNLQEGKGCEHDGGFHRFQRSTGKQDGKRDQSDHHAPEKTQPTVRIVTFLEITRTLQLFLTLVAVISLVVGGIGVMNIMLVSVTERTREIGIRMAVGARASDVLQQFLIEAVLVCLVGGALGITLSLLIAFTLQLFLPGWEIGFSPLALLLAFLCSTVTGILFGWLPARNAARLDPVDALARE